MTFDEWKKLVKGLKSVYTSEKFLPDGDSVKIWYELLKDMDYKVLNLAIQKYMLTGKFAPTVAELRECAVGITDPTTTNDYGDGWEQVLRAVSKYGYYNADEALASMDEVTRKCVKRLGWKNICMSENPVADRANFRQIYEQEKQKRKEYQQLPDNVKQAIALIQSEVRKIETGKPEQETKRQGEDTDNTATAWQNQERDFKTGNRLGVVTDTCGGC